MLTVVYGGNVSGKSSLAEKLATDYYQKKCGASGSLVYLATMQDDGSEQAAERIAQHRASRKDKGFVTVECPSDFPVSCTLPEDTSVILLEDLGNLAANEFFGKAGQVEAQKVADCVHRIEKELSWLAEQTDHLVIVTNNIFDGGIETDEGMQRYAQVLGEMNQRLAADCDVFVESVCGLVHVLKGRLP